MNPDFLNRIRESEKNGLIRNTGVEYEISQRKILFFMNILRCGAS